MATRLEFDNQFTLVNAPAGSGKTTAISDCVSSLLPELDKKILCITYTNRAADGLNEKIISENVDIGTIHSFISKFMNRFFSIKEVVEFYFEFYFKEINYALINLTEEKEERYRGNFNIDADIEINVEKIKYNINKLEYNEIQYSNWLYGDLSHDDLLVFSDAMLTRFPKISKVLSQNYSYIFIDEYQDTHASVLNMFYKSLRGSKTKLILLGDKMQQIYSDRVESFMSVIDDEFHKDLSLSTNWRSQEMIVSLLNNLYFDKKYKQKPNKPKGKKPKFIVVDSFENHQQKDRIKLVLLNSKMYESLGSRNIYIAYGKRYKYYSNHSAKEILSDTSLENPDDLLRLLIFITKICELYNQNKYGKLIQMVKGFKYANKTMWNITSHTDKLIIKKSIEGLISKIYGHDIRIGDIIDYLKSEEGIIESKYIAMIEENISKTDEIDGSQGFKSDILGVKYTEFKNYYNEVENPRISTQHAVKGEGHNNVELDLEDYHNPNVQMYLFLELFSHGLFNYAESEEVLLHCKKLKVQFEENNNIKLNSSLRRQEYERLEQKINEFSDELTKLVSSSPDLYRVIFKGKVEAYQSNKKVTKFVNLVKVVNKLEGVIQAYKLFYVGCSRAKEDLNVFVLANKVEPFRIKLLTKMEKVGFDIG